ncbi:glycosyltransferase [Nitrospinota bacterium]
MNNLPSGRLRIALLAMHTDPLGRLGGEVSGGMNVYVRETARVLPSLGAHVDIFTRAADADSPALIELAPGARFIRIPAGPRRPADKNLQARFTGDFASGIQDFAGLHGDEYDLISSHYWLSAVAGKQLALEWKAPLVHRFHTIAAQKNRALSGENGLESEERVREEARIAKGADALVASSAAEADLLTGVLGAEKSKVHIVPCGVDTERFKPLPRAEARAALGLNAEERILLSVGRIEPVKGLERLVPVLSSLRAMQPTLKTTIIHVGGEVWDSNRGGGGGGCGPEDFSSPIQRDEVHRVLNIAEEAGVAEDFRFTGAKPQEELRLFYSAADALSIPSRYETFSLVALEAAACGLPAVAFGVGGLSSAIEPEKSGFIVPDGDIEAFSEAALRLIATPGVRAKLGDRARKRAESFSWSLVASKEFDVWKSLLQSRRRHQKYMLESVNV